jgi:hypothetical protein
MLKNLNGFFMKNLKIIKGFLPLLAVIAFQACYKNSTVIPDNVDEITRPISFVADVVPVFNSSCNMSGCHSSGGKAPDLSSANAWSSLLGSGYISTDDPQSSTLYLWMSGKKGTPMPVSGINKEYNAVILAWIKQGALNN